MTYYSHQASNHSSFRRQFNVSLGLIVAMALKIAAPVRRDVPMAGLAAATFIAIALLRVPMLLAIVVMAPLGIALAWRRQR